MCLRQNSIPTIPYRKGFIIIYIKSPKKRKFVKNSETPFNTTQTSAKSHAISYTLYCPPGYKNLNKRLHYHYKWREKVSQRKKRKEKKGSTWISSASLWINQTSQIAREIVDLSFFQNIFVVHLVSYLYAHDQRSLKIKYSKTFIN